MARFLLRRCVLPRPAPALRSAGAGSALSRRPPPATARAVSRAFSATSSPPPEFDARGRPLGAAAPSAEADEARRAALRKFGIDPDKPSASADAGEPVAVANAPPRAADAAASTSGAEVSQSVTDAWMDYADYMTHQRDRGWKD